MNMERMEALSNEAYEWLEELAPNTWVRALFSDFPKCNILLNNNCEVFNKYILNARELPILSMMVRTQVMNIIVGKQNEVEKWSGTICPKIKKKLEKNAEMANTCYAMPSGMGMFQVQDKNFQCIVDLTTKHCDCRRWDLTGISCSHAISCLRHERTQPEEMVSSCYFLQTFRNAYSFNFMPTRDQKCWEKTNGVNVNPPVYDKKVGRPRKARRKQPHELQGGSKMSKHGVQMHCSYCKGTDHNIKKCELKKAGKKAQKLTAKRKRTTLPPGEEEEVDPVITQAEVHSTPLNEIISTQMSSTMMSQLIDEVIPPRMPFQQAGPLPESSFIQTNWPQARHGPITTATKEGSPGRPSARMSRGVVPRRSKFDVHL